jgi:hypothetical protein
MDSIPHSGRQARRDLLHSLVSAVAAVLVIAAVFATPVGLLWVLFWTTEGAWEFEGQSGVRHWLFIKGKWIDRLGLVEQAGPARYSVSLPEGTFPGWAVLNYDSSAPPAMILDTYAERCRKLGLKVTKEPAVWEHGADGMYLECEIEKYLDAQFVAERKPPAELTEVSLRVWGRD